MLPCHVRPFFCPSPAMCDLSVPPQPCVTPLCPSPALGNPPTLPAAAEPLGFVPAELRPAASSAFVFSLQRGDPGARGDGGDPIPQEGPGEDHAQGGPRVHRPGRAPGYVGPPGRGLGTPRALLRLVSFFIYCCLPWQKQMSPVHVCRCEVMLSVPWV